MQHVASFVHYTERDDVTNLSTSMSYLETHYNTNIKGANLLMIPAALPANAGMEDPSLEGSLFY